MKIYKVSMCIVALAVIVGLAGIHEKRIVIASTIVMALSLLVAFISALTAMFFKNPIASYACIKCGKVCKQPVIIEVERQSENQDSNYPNGYKTWTCPECEHVHIICKVCGALEAFCA